MFRPMHKFSYELSTFPDQCGGVITKIPELLGPLRGPVLLMENMPRESVRPVGIQGLSIKDVLVFTFEVSLEE